MRWFASRADSVRKVSAVLGKAEGADDRFTVFKL